MPSKEEILYDKMSDMAQDIKDIRKEDLPRLMIAVEVTKTRVNGAWLAIFALATALSTIVIRIWDKL